MPPTIRADRNIFRATFSGVVNPAEIKAYAEAVSAADASLGVAADRLIDMREVTHFDLRYEDVAAFVRARREREYTNNFKVAFLAMTPLQYGFLRMFQTLLDDPRVRIQLFADEDVALAWLSATPPP